jgi:hypothetical protein
VRLDLLSPLPLESCGRSENRQRQKSDFVPVLGGEQRVCSGTCAAQC